RLHASPDHRAPHASPPRRSSDLRRFRVHTLDGFSFQEGDDGLVMALGALVAYLAEVQPAGIAHLRPPRIERPGRVMALDAMTRRDRKSTRLNSSHVKISYAVFCL